MRSPIKWLGGKGHMVSNILPLLPAHEIYVEPFGGGASILLAKAPSNVEVYNDIDSGLVTFFRVLRDEEMSAEFMRRVRLVPYSREEYIVCRETWKDVDDPVEKALRWFVVGRQSFGGRFGKGWGYSLTSSRGQSMETASWTSTVDNLLPQVIERMRMVVVENNDWRVILDTYDTPDTLFYCDPPYVTSTRRDGEYRHELTEEDHEELVERLLNISGKVILSGYDNHLYRKLEHNGWGRHEFQTTCSVAGRTRRSDLKGVGTVTKKQGRVECVWVSPHAIIQPRLF